MVLKLTSGSIKLIFIGGRYWYNSCSVSLSNTFRSQFHAIHDDVIKLKHFPRYWPFVRGIHRWIPPQRLVTQSFDVFCELCLNKRFSKHSKRRWFQAPSRSLWRHCNVNMLGNERKGQHLVVGIYISTSNGSWCMGIKGEMSGTVCVTFTWDMYIYMSCL